MGVKKNDFYGLTKLYYHHNHAFSLVFCTSVGMETVYENLAFLQSLLFPWGPRGDDNIIKFMTYIPPTLQMLHTKNVTIGPAVFMRLKM